MRRLHSVVILPLLAVLICHAQSPSKPPASEVLIASDIHFNPVADPALVADLAAAPPQRWEQILNRSKLKKYSTYRQDTNWWLLHSALREMSAQNPHRALVMITGDLLAHNFPQAWAKTANDTDREHYRIFVLKTLAFLSWELRRQFKHAQILVTPGNDDNDCGDYEIAADGPFLTDTAPLARKLARAGTPFIGDWKALGSFSLKPRAIRGVRILSVNSVFFSSKYQSGSFDHGCSAVASTSATRTFDWLSSQLAQARQAHEKVWLMFHIPPGIDGYATMVAERAIKPESTVNSEEQCRQAIVPMWKPEWTARFIKLLEEYSPVVTATFAGHTHSDDFRLISPGETGAEFVLINPPISPIYGQNPAFRIVAFSSDGQLANQSTWYLNNLPANPAAGQGTWVREYSFAEEWKTPRLDASSLNSIYGRIRSEPAARAQWLTLLNVSSSRDPVPANGIKSLTCAIDALDPAAYQFCACPR
jgi:sphingomyelin phosphodiesterase acid-like 3